jgi:flagellar biosynthetic protein FliR
MAADPVFAASITLGFLLTLVRVAGVFVFVPLPGMTGTLQPARILLAGGITIALFPEWPQVSADVSAGQFLFWIVTEAALGIGIGLCLAFVAESFNIGAQVMGMQAGYAFASMVDPNTQADSSVLVIFAQLSAGLLFFTLGLDREVLRIFARSLETHPAGSFTLTSGAAGHVLTLGSTMFSTGIRLALPLIAIMIMVDISLALLGRVNAQLQLITIAFPVKMMVSLLLLGWLISLLPAMYRADAGSAFGVARRLIAR